jgi:hypothetical protein
MEQIRALSDQLDAMNVANGRCRQPSPRFVDEDDVITFSEARSQRRKVWFDTQSLRWATLTVIHEPQIHLIWRRKMNLLMKSSKKTSSLMRSLNMEMFMMEFVRDKINPEDTWILILNHLRVTSQTFVTTQ